MDGTSGGAWVPEHPVLEGLSRPTVHGGSWNRDVWLWPLPTPGPLRVVSAWPDRGIAETSVTTDAAPVLDAAARARPLWG